MIKREGDLALTQGYVILACGPLKYREMAINIARSIRMFDPARSICMVHDEVTEVTAECIELFDHFALLKKEKGYIGVMNKVRLYDLSPYDQTMYVDADMLLFKPNIAAYWSKLNGHFFGMTGAKRTTGHWYGKDISHLVKKFEIPFIVQMNSGVFYFEKNAKAANFFERLLTLFHDHKDELSSIHQNISGQYADEPVFGIAMGEAHVEPIPTIIGQGSWMITTWQSRRLCFNPDTGVSHIQKSSGYPYRQAWLSRSWVDHSPNFVHFIGLKPRAIYENSADWFRNNLPSKN